VATAGGVVGIAGGNTTDTPGVATAGDVAASPGENKETATTAGPGERNLSTGLQVGVDG